MGAWAAGAAGGRRSLRDSLFWRRLEGVWGAVCWRPEGARSDGVQTGEVARRGERALRAAGVVGDGLRGQRKVDISNRQSKWTETVGRCFNTYAARPPVYSVQCTTKNRLHFCRGQRAVLVLLVGLRALHRQLSCALSNSDR